MSFAEPIPLLTPFTIFAVCNTKFNFKDENLVGNRGLTRANTVQAFVLIFSIQ